MGWTKNVEVMGTEGYSYRLEGIGIKMVVEGENVPGAASKCFYKYNF